MSRSPRFGAIGVVGAGAYGAALALAASRAGRDVRLWAREAATVEAIRRTRQAPRLPGIELPEPIRATDALADLAACDTLIVAVPTQSLREACTAMAAILPAGLPVISAAKGIEQASGLFPTQIIAASWPAAPSAILSGPSFAADIGRGLPTAVTLAAADARLAQALAEALSSPAFRIYHSGDPRGVEIGGGNDGAGLRFTVNHQLREGADIGRDHRHGAGHGFQRRQAESFPALRGDEHVQCTIPVIDIGVLADEQDTIRQSRCRDALLQFGFEGDMLGGGAAGDDGDPVRPRGQQADHRIDEQIRALLMADATEAAGNFLRRIEAERAFCRAPVGRRGKPRGVDAVADDGVGDREVSGGAGAGGDHRIHAANQKFRPAAMSPLRGGGEDDLQRHAQEVAQHERRQHLDVAAGMPDAPTPP